MKLNRILAVVLAGLMVGGVNVQGGVSRIANLLGDLEYPGCCYAIAMSGGQKIVREIVRPKFDTIFDRHKYHTPLDNRYDWTVTCCNDCGDRASRCNVVLNGHIPPGDTYDRRIEAGENDTPQLQWGLYYGDPNARVP